MGVAEMRKKIGTLRSASAHALAANYYFPSNHRVRACKGWIIEVENLTLSCLVTHGPVALGIQRTVKAFIRVQVPKNIEGQGNEVQALPFSDLPCTCAKVCSMLCKRGERAKHLLCNLHQSVGITSCRRVLQSKADETTRHSIAAHILYGSW
jgi:hypothetical protein